jgi:D-alanyl-D-alanine carboxypeptidase
VNPGICGLVAPFLAGLAAADAAPGAAWAQERPERAELRQRIEAIAAKAVDRQGVPGIAIAVGKDSELWFASAFGYADPAHGTPVDGDTGFRAGTLARQLVAAAVLQLAEAGKLKLDDPIGKHRTDLPEWARGITIEQMLSGTSGIPSEEALKAGSGSLVERLRKAAPDFPPGEGYAADSAAWPLLQQLVEGASGASFETWARAHLIEPAGLEHTGFCPLDATPAEVASLCKGSRAPPATPAPGLDARGLCASAGDLFRWQCAIADRTLLGEASSRRFLASGARKDGRPTDAGFATRIGKLDRFTVVGQTGASRDYRARVAFYPEARATVVVMANCAAADVDRMEQEIARLLLGLLPAEIVDLPPEPALMHGCAGTYLIATTQVRIFEKSGKLWFEEPGRAAIAMLYQGRNVFVSAGEDRFRLTFRIEGDRPAESFEILRAGSISTGKRIDDRPGTNRNTVPGQIFRYPKVD